MRFLPKTGIKLTRQILGWFAETEARTKWFLGIGFVYTLLIFLASMNIHHIKEFSEMLESLPVIGTLF